MRFAAYTEVEVKPGSVAWAATIAAGFAWEIIAISRRNDRWPTLSSLVFRHVPRWLRATALGWLAFHWLVGDILVSDGKLYLERRK